MSLLTVSQKKIKQRNWLVPAKLDNTAFFRRLTELQLKFRQLALSNINHQSGANSHSEVMSGCKIWGKPCSSVFNESVKLQLSLAHLKATQTWTYVHTYVHMCVRTYVLTYVSTYIRMYVHVCVKAGKHLCVRLSVKVYLSRHSLLRFS